MVAGTILLLLVKYRIFRAVLYEKPYWHFLEDGFVMIHDVSAAGALESAAFDVTFDNLCANGNITVLIMSSNRVCRAFVRYDPEAVCRSSLWILFLAAK